MILKYLSVTFWRPHTDRLTVWLVLNNFYFKFSFAAIALSVREFGIPRSFVSLLFRYRGKNEIKGTSITIINPDRGIRLIQRQKAFPCQFSFLSICSRVNSAACVIHTVYTHCTFKRKKL